MNYWLMKSEPDVFGIDDLKEVKVEPWDGVRNYAAKYHDYLQGQIGNPEGEDKPNKKYYDPRKWLRAAEESTVVRLERAFDDLNCLNRN